MHLAILAATVTILSWTADNGTLSFTNQREWVPEKYVATMEERSLGDLKDYPRLTVDEGLNRKPVDPSAYNEEAPVEKVPTLIIKGQELIDGTVCFYEELWVNGKLTQRTQCQQ